MNNISGIYMIRNKVNGKVYIGSTKNFSHRKSSHLRDLKNECHHSDILQKSWDKHGEQNFDFLFLCLVKNLDRLIEAEQIFMDEFKSYERRYGYNILRIAGSCIGVKRSERYKKMLSDKTKERWRKNYKKMAKYASDSWTKERRELNRRKFDTKSFICHETGEIFNNVSDCADKMSLQSSEIHRCLRRERIHLKKFTFSFLDDLTPIPIKRIGHNKPFVCDQTGEFFKNITQAALKFDMCISSISNLLRNKTKSRRGFSFSYTKG